MKQTSIQQRIAALSAVTLLMVTMGSATAPTDTPQGTVEAVIAGLSNNQPQVLWQSLPASYQRDVSQFLAQAAERNDPEVWDASFRLVGKIGRVAGEKRDFLAENPFIAQQLVLHPELTEAWDQIVDLLVLLTNSRLADNQALRDLDIEQYLATTGSEIMLRTQRILAILGKDSAGWSLPNELAGGTVRLLTWTGANASVEVSLPDHGSKILNLVEVEGKWIPAEMAQHWSEAFSSLSTQLSALDPARLAEGREMVLTAIATVEQSLDEMLDAQTQREFDMAFQNLFGAVMMTIMNHRNQQPGG